MKELKVGERITLEVVESSLCTGCYFENWGTCPNGCSPYERSDDKSVIYKLIEE